MRGWKALRTGVTVPRETKATPEGVREAFWAVLLDGKYPSTSRVRDITGGSQATVHKHLVALRKELESSRESHLPSSIPPRLARPFLELVDVAKSLAAEEHSAEQEVASSTIKRSKASLGIARERCRNLIKLVRANQRFVLELEDQLKSSDSAKLDAEARAKTLTSNLDEAKTALLASVTRERELQEALTNQERHHSEQLASARAQARADAAASAERYAGLEARSAREIDEARQATISARAELDEARAVIAQLRAEKDSANSRAADARLEAQQAKSDNATLQSEAARLQDDISGIREELHRTRTLAEERAIQIAKLEASKPAKPTRKRQSKS